ncbi:MULTISPECIES: hypothetical protein [Microbacterium]
MDSGFFSHVMIVVVGAIATLGGIGLIGALVSLGRTAAYKKH